MLLYTIENGTEKGKKMPVVFWIEQRIKIYMHFNEHNPPHIHAYIGGKQARFNFDGEMEKGEFSAKDKKIVSDWIKNYTAEIKANWKNIEEGKPPCKIPPHTK